MRLLRLEKRLVGRWGWTFMGRGGVDVYMNEVQYAISKCLTGFYSSYSTLAFILARVSSSLAYRSVVLSTGASLDSRASLSTS